MAQNHAKLAYMDKKNRLASLEVNGVRVGMDMLYFRDAADRLRTRYQVRLATQWNPSSPLAFEALSVAAICRKIARHEHKLVKPIYPF